MHRDKYNSLKVINLSRHLRNEYIFARFIAYIYIFPLPIKNYSSDYTFQVHYCARSLEQLSKTWISTTSKTFSRDWLRTLINLPSRLSWKTYNSIARNFIITWKLSDTNSITACKLSPCYISFVTQNPHIRYIIRLSISK